MDMGVVGVPVLDPAPVETGAEIPFHLRHQFPRESLEVAHLPGVFGRDDKAEMVPVILAARGKLAAVEFLALSPE